MGVLKSGYISYPGLIVVANDGFKDGQCMYENNHLGRNFNLLMIGARKRIKDFNCTLTEFESNGKIDPQTGRYVDGIFGALQSGEIDLSFMPNYYPLQDENDEFVYSSPVYEDTMTIGSYYEMTTGVDGPSSDIIYMFSTIPQGLWIGLSVTFIVLVALLMLGDKLLGNRNRPSALLKVFRAFLGDDNFSDDGLFYLTYATFASVSLFFAIAYLGNCVSTDLVVVDEPVTFTSYDDILKRKTKVGFSDQLAETLKFKYAPPGSIYHDLWQLSSPFKSDPQEMPIFIDVITKQKIVLVSRELLAISIGNLIFAELDRQGRLDKDLKMARFLAARDERARKFTNVYVSNKYTAGTEFPKVAQEVVMTLFEGGIIKYVFDKFPEVVVSLLYTVKPSITRKISWHIEKGDSDFIPVGFQNIKILLACFMGCICVSVIVLLCEKLLKHSARKKPRVYNVIPMPRNRALRNRMRARRSLHFEEIIHATHR